jgi:hypothetical protein
VAREVHLRALARFTVPGPTEARRSAFIRCMLMSAMVLDTYICQLLSAKIARLITCVVRQYTGQQAFIQPADVFSIYLLVSTANMDVPLVTEATSDFFRNVYGA